MRSARRGATAFLLAAMLAVGFISSSQTVAVGTSSAWQLVDNHQRTCFVSTRGGTSYYGIWISGTWRHVVTVGASALPGGGSYYTFYAPIAPGSSDGIGSLAYVAVAMPAGSPVGTYTSSLWVTDGRHRQAVPITLVVQGSSCSHY